jgi:rhodanese-related sulfurtransferase
MMAALCRWLLSWWVAAAVPFALADDFQTPAIAAAELMARQGKPDAPLVVDVRPNGEYKSGHVAGAVNIPYDKMEKHLDQLTQAKNGVVLYCTQGHRTKQAEQTLLDNEVPNVSHLQGGLGAWRQGGYPIHTGWGP